MINLRKKIFEIKLTRRGILKSGHPFRLSTNYIDGSGGHAHINRRQETDDNYGYFQSRQVEELSGRPLDDTTRSDYMPAYDYNSSIFGDTMKIYLRSRTNPLLCDSVSVVEKVAGLELLPDGTNYLKVGGTCNHHGPSIKSELEVPQNCRTPDNNHWCTPSFADSLQLAINKFHDFEISDKGDGISIIVYLNDMSLPLGGRFDIDGLWDQVPPGKSPRQRHLYHRIGTSVDINPTLTVIQLEQLKKFMNRHQLFRDKERPEIHFGFTEGN